MRVREERRRAVTWIDCGIGSQPWGSMAYMDGVEISWGESMITLRHEMSRNEWLPKENKPNREIVYCALHEVGQAIGRRPTAKVQ